jgi:hypothetical protein
VSLPDHVARVLKGVALFGTAACALAVSGVAHGANPKPPPRPLPPSSGISQYVEDVPSAAGPRAAGQATSGGARLSRSAREQLSNVDKATARALERIATSSAYGAPDARTRRSAGGSQTPSAGSAAASAVLAEENGNLDVVLAVLALVSVAAVGTAVARARRARADSG